MVNGLNPGVSVARPGRGSRSLESFSWLTIVFLSASEYNAVCHQPITFCLVRYCVVSSARTTSDHVRQIQNGGKCYRRREHWVALGEWVPKSQCFCLRFPIPIETLSLKFFIVKLHPEYKDRRNHNTWYPAGFLFLKGEQVKAVKSWKSLHFHDSFGRLKLRRFRRGLLEGFISLDNEKYQQMWLKQL